jgi:hypothetical protein
VVHKYEGEKFVPVELDEDSIVDFVPNIHEIEEVSKAKEAYDTLAADIKRIEDDFPMPQRGEMIRLFLADLEAKLEILRKKISD